MEKLPTTIKDLVLIKPRVFEDPRGFFLESYSGKTFGALGITARFVQDNHSLSTGAGVVRGLHFQRPPHTQAKLIRVVHGAVYDVTVDLRKKSPTFGAWEGFELTAKNFLMLYVPRGFAHGFCTLEENTEVIYKSDAFYAPEAEAGIRWNDPSLNICWPVQKPVLSDKDAAAPFFSEITSPF